MSRCGNEGKRREARPCRHMTDDRRPEHYASENLTDDPWLPQSLKEIAKKMGTGNKEEEKKQKRTDFSVRHQRGPGATKQMLKPH